MKTKKFLEERLKKVRQTLACPLIPEDAFDAMEREEEEILKCLSN